MGKRGSTDVFLYLSDAGIKRGFDVCISLVSFKIYSDCIDGIRNSGDPTAKRLKTDTGYTQRGSKI